jgi:hypothetical protein
MLRTLTILAAIGTSIGCDVLPAPACDSSAFSSVTVSVVDSGGFLVSADDVTYEVDGLDEVSCDPLDGSGQEWVCGYEETGDFLIRVYVGSEVYDASLSVGMRPDGCHVDSQFIDVTVN